MSVPAPASCSSTSVSVPSVPVDEHYDLKCPLFSDWFVDPIALPCCGQAVSRQALHNWLIQEISENRCPMCRTDVGEFDLVSAPMLTNLNSLVDQAKRKEEESSSSVLSIEGLFAPEKKQEVKEQWKAKLHCLSSSSLNSVYQSKIGKLVISSSTGSHKFKTLLIPVIDVSGSMRSAMAQVRYSLHRIAELTHDNPHLVTNLVTYSDSAKTIVITNDRYHCKRVIDALVVEGGTSFKVAFEEIVKVCKNYVNDNTISSMVIIFLTDGQDSNTQQGNARTQLVTKLKNDLTANWSTVTNNKPFTVHTIGFTNSHDGEFLNLLGQDSDSLSNKINSLLNVIVSSNTVPLRLLSRQNSPPELKTVNASNTGEYWLNLTGYDWHSADAPLVFAISVNGQSLVEVVAEIAEDENAPQIWDEWYSNLIDDIAS